MLILLEHALNGQTGTFSLPAHKTLTTSRTSSYSYVLFCEDLLIIPTKTVKIYSNSKPCKKKYKAKVEQHFNTN